jgi:hypothetical protein
MADLFLLSQAQMRRIERYFPLSHGIARVDDRRIVSAILDLPCICGERFKVYAACLSN